LYFDKFLAFAEVKGNHQYFFGWSPQKEGKLVSYTKQSILAKIINGFTATKLISFFNIMPYVLYGFVFRE